MTFGEYISRTGNEFGGPIRLYRSAVSIGSLVSPEHGDLLDSLREFELARRL